MIDFLLIIIFVLMLKYIIDTINLIKPPKLGLSTVGVGELSDSPETEQGFIWKESLMFKKGDMEMPEPDPAIGQAALDNMELGQAQLDFSKQQYADLMKRQEKTDAITQDVVDAQLEAMRQTTEWGQEDRQIAKNYRDKFDAQSDQDRAKGIEYRDQMDSMAENIRNQGAATGERFGEIADRQGQFSDEQMQRYKDGFAPLEDRYAKDASEWDSSARMDERAAEAKAGVLSNAEQQRRSAQRQMASMGIDPRSGRYAGISQAGEQNTALAAADAQNKARKDVRGEAINMRRDAINVGQGIQSNAQQASSMESAALGNKLNSVTQGNSQALQAKNLGLAASGLGNTAAGMSMGNQGAGYQGITTGMNAGSTALQTNQAGTQGVYNAGNVMNQGFAGNMNGNSSGASILGSLYGQQMDAYNADQQAAGAFWGGIGSAAGMLGGAAIMASSKDYKENKKPIKGSALKAAKEMPVESWKYKDGIADGGDHIGPYAEDFKAATGKGDGKSIPMQDMMGLQLKAIQELGLEVEKLKAKNKPAIEGQYKRIA